MYDALYDPEASHEDIVECYQALVDSGTAWKLEGHIGRTAMALIEDGVIMLGEEPRWDYWGNRVPSRFEVVPGTKGSPEFVERKENSL